MFLELPEGITSEAHHLIETKEPWQGFESMTVGGGRPTVSPLLHFHDYPRPSSLFEPNTCKNCLSLYSSCTDLVHRSHWTPDPGLCFSQEVESKDIDAADEAELGKPMKSLPADRATSSLTYCLTQPHPSVRRLA